jgi:hypothetical protein
MTHPEHVLSRRRLQTRAGGEEAGMKTMLDALDDESAWIDGFIIRLTDVLREIRH